MRKICFHRLQKRLRIDIIPPVPQYAGKLSPALFIRIIDDPRTAIVLTASECALVLDEMRSFLASVQRITIALSSNDMSGVTAAARKAGRAAQR